MILSQNLFHESHLLKKYIIQEPKHTILNHQDDKGKK